MMVMLGLCEEPDTRPFEVFCAIHSAVFKDSVLKENPRIKQMVLTMATYSSLGHMLSYYERIDSVDELEDLFSVTFLSFLRCNWVLDPYSIVFACTTQLTGVDPQARYKVLSLLKNHVQRDAQDRVLRSADMKYLRTSLYVDAPILQDLTNELGIGYAIFEAVVQDLMVKSAAQMPIIITESQGYKKDFYCILPQGCSTIRTLSGVENAIVKHLYSHKARALVSSDQKSLVFPQHVRNSVLKEHLRPTSLENVSDVQMDSAITSLDACGISFYGDNPTLRTDQSAQVMVVQPHETPGSILADPGSLLDPEFSGNVWFKPGLVMNKVVVWKGDDFVEYEKIRNGRDPLIEEKQNKEARVIDYFMHAMQTPREGADPEELYTGIHNNGEVIIHEVQPVQDELRIVNPDFRPSSSRRMSTGAPIIKTSTFFDHTKRNVDIRQYTGLMEVAQTARMETMLYGQDTAKKVYGEGGLLF